MIRQVVAADFEKLSPLMNELFSKDKLDMDTTKRIFLDMLSSDGVKYYVLEKDSQFIGYAAFSVRLNVQIGGKIAELEELFVLEEFRGKGYGKELLNYVEEVSKSEGCLELRFCSNFKREKAHAFYDSQGYTKSSYLFWKVF